jgi:Cupin domain
MYGRLVVTGHREGRSVFVSDDKIDSVEVPGAGYQFAYWSANEPAKYPGPGENPRAPEHFPPVGGTRFLTMVFTPQVGATTATVQREEASSSGKLGSDLAGAMEPDNPGMHTTDSTDFAIVTSGQIGLELDDGAELILSAGDAIVQNGTRHRWRVVGDEAATLIFVLTGARRS